MDAIKILGDLLGNKSMARGGLGEQILKGILKGNFPGAQQPGQPPMPQPTRSPIPQNAPAQQPTMQGWDSPPRSPAEVLRGGGSGRSGAQSQQPMGAFGGILRQAVERYMKGATPGQPTQAPQPGHGHHPQPGQGQAQAGSCDTDPNEQAKMMIRAMINAAKADGRIDQEEQNNIVSKLGNLSQDEVQFLRHEFSQPLDVRAFARNVPRGMEQEVYALSLTAIDLDTNPEAKYLHELSQELRIPQEVCNQIHAHFGAPQLYS